MRVFAVVAAFIATVNWSQIAKYTTAVTTPVLAYFAKEIRKFLKRILDATKETPEIKKEVAVIKVDIANVKDQVADVSSDLSAVRREVAHRHIENREHLDGLKDEIKRQTSISQETFIKAVGEPLIEISTSMKQNRGPRSTDPPGTGTQQEGT